MSSEHKPPTIVPAPLPTEVSNIYATRLLRQSVKPLIYATIAGIIGAALTIGQLAIISDQMSTARMPLIAIVIISLLAFGASLITRMLTMTLAARLTAELRRRLFDVLLNSTQRSTEMLGFANIFEHDLQIFTVTSFIESLSSLIPNGSLVIAGLLYGAFLNAKLLVAVILLAIPVVFSTAKLSNKAAALDAQSRDPHALHMMRMMDFATNSSAKLKVHSASREEFSQMFDKVIGSIRTLTTRSRAIMSVSNEMNRFMLFFIFFAMLKLSPMLGVTQQVTLSFAILILYLMGPFDHVVAGIGMIARTRTAQQKLATIKLAKDHTDLATAPSSPKTLSKIQLRGLTLKFANEDHFQFGPVDLELVPGEVVFITGGNGAGKSTFIKLLSALYPPDSGEIILNDVIVDDQSRAEYRNLFSLLLQDNDPYCAALPMKNFDAVLVEKFGLTRSLDRNSPNPAWALSHGQRSRVGLLEALFFDRPIMVFDEWAADQDPYYRRYFYEELIPQLKAKGKCVIVISHDEAFFHMADRRVHLERGRVVKEFNRTELIAISMRPPQRNAH